MKDFFKKVGAMLGALLLVMASVFSVVAGFQYSVLFGIASIVLVIAAIPVGYTLIEFLLKG